jgi:GT2 family glycosyltransferase
MSGTQSPQLLDLVIPTCNRPEMLCLCLKALVLQMEHLGTVYIVNDGTVSIRGVCRDVGLRNLVVLEGSHQGPCLARNQALERVKAEYVAFLDDDSIPDQNWAASCLDLFNRFPGVTAQLGRIDWVGIAGNVRSRMKIWQRSFLPQIRQKIYDSRHNQYMSPSYRQTFSKTFQEAIPPDLPGVAQHLSGGNAAIRTRFLRCHGFFNPRFKRQNDREMAYRILSKGCVIAYNPDMKVAHDHDPSILRSLKGIYRVTPYQRLLDATYPNPCWLAHPIVQATNAGRHFTSVATCTMNPLERFYLSVLRLVHAVVFKLTRRVP